MVTKERLRELFDYNESTGIFTRIKAPKHHPRLLGREAGYLHNGYIDIKVDGVAYKAHRLVFLYINGCFTTEQVDHINGIKHDNRLCNLKEVSRSENQQNLSASSKKKESGLPFGVSRHGKKFRSMIWINSKNIHLGTFITPEEAHEKYIEAKRKYHHWGREESTETVSGNGDKQNIRII